MVVAKGNNIFEVIETPIRDQRPPQFLLPEGHKVLEVTDDFVICECSLMVYSLELLYSEIVCPSGADFFVS